MNILSRVILVVGFVFIGLSSVDEAGRLEQEPQADAALSIEVADAAEDVEAVEIIFPADVAERPLLRHDQLFLAKEKDSVLFSPYVLTLQSDPRRDNQETTYTMTYKVLVSEIVDGGYEAVCDKDRIGWAIYFLTRELSDRRFEFKKLRNLPLILKIFQTTIRRHLPT